MSAPFTPEFVILVIMDGWGIAPDSPGNAITKAKTTNVNTFWYSYPHTELEASGQAVGLPRGEDGNTETGHLNLGAGRIVYQDLERINKAIAEGTFDKNEAFKKAVDHVKNNNSKLHLMGLVGAGGVHANNEHLYALIKLARDQGAPNLYLHLFTDGRDSPPTSATTYIQQIEEVIKADGIGIIASVMGRYWAMDRDKRWDRTKKAYDALTKAAGNTATSAEEAISASYELGKNDEFIEPTIITDNGKPIATITDNDAVIFFNFRVDRPRQLTKAFVFDPFTHASVANDFDAKLYNHKEIPETSMSTNEPFDRGKKIANLCFVTMTQYSKTLDEAGILSAFPPEPVKNPLGSVLSLNDIHQLRVTESEKERFVTYYFNGLHELPFPNELHLIIPSPKVLTYDQQPEMSADEVTSEVLNKMKQDHFRFILINFPNADMVGHTGNIEPTIRAVEKVDDCLGRLANYVLAFNGAMLLTADHGNAEEMINLKTNQVDTEHSTNRVPFIAVARPFLGKSQKLQSGILADIAPTILGLFNIPIPVEMTGRDLLKGVLDG